MRFVQMLTAEIDVVDGARSGNALPVR